MALQGTIETFALPEVLRLLGSGGKTGRLRLSGDRGSGSIWVDGGKVVAAEATGIREGTSPTGVVFELLRYAEGSFTFDDDQSNMRPGTPQDIEVLLGDAERQLADWREIETVVPSLAVRLALADELPDAEVTLDGNNWRSVVAVARGGDVAAIADALDLGELEACRRAKDLIEAGLAVVTELEPEPIEPIEPIEPAVGESEESDGSDAVADGEDVAPLEAAPIPMVGERAAAALPADPTPLEDWGAPVDEVPVGYDAGEISGPGEFTSGARDAAEAVEPVGMNGHAGNGYETGPYGSGVFSAEPSSARADLDAMASGFGLSDAPPTLERESYGVPGYDTGESGSFEGGSFEGGGFDGGGFDHAFAADPSQDPAFSFAAPEVGPAEHGGGDASATLAPAAALFADDLHRGARADASDPRLGGTVTGVDDGGDAAEVARQLANLSPKAARAVAAAARATTVEEREAALAEVTAEGDEPINRGLLLKFLSSVQT